MSWVYLPTEKNREKWGARTDCHFNLSKPSLKTVHLWEGRRQRTCVQHGNIIEKNLKATGINVLERVKTKPNIYLCMDPIKEKKTDFTF